jgi:hypothetical protein
MEARLETLERVYEGLLALQQTLEHNVVDGNKKTTTDHD